MRGKYIVIEGAEGVGKTTQVHKLAEALRSLEIPVKVFREPDGECDSTTQVIRQITQDPSYPMNSRTEVLLYSAGRSQSLEKIRAARDDGFVCLVDRSFLTTLAVQYYGRGDISDYERLNQIIDFAVGNTKPDLTIVLDAPVDVLVARKSQTGEKERFDELDAPFLERIRSGYLWEARQRSLPIVYALGTTDEVFQDVWRLLTPVLELEVSRGSASAPTSVADIIESLQKTPEHALESTTEIKAQTHEVNADNDDDLPYHVPVSFFVPTELEGETRAHYVKDLTEIIDTRETMVRQLTQYLLDENLADMPSVATTLAERKLRPVLPWALLGEHHTRTNLDETVRSLAAKLLPRNWAKDDQPMRLVRASPRNELDCLTEALYEYSDLPLVDIEAMVHVLPYEAKAQLLNSYLSGHHTDQTLRSVTYEWDVVTSYTTYEEFVRVLDDVDTVLQAPNPRLGFDTPDIVEKAGLGDDYLSCFDQSLALNSAMQAAGQEQAAKCAVLLGHRLRWKVTINAYDMRKLNQLANDTSVSEDCLALILSLLEKVGEVHPLMSESYR